MSGGRPARGEGGGVRVRVMVRVRVSLGTLVEGRPGTTIFQNPGGGGAGGGSHTRTRPGCPPGPAPLLAKQMKGVQNLL